VRSISFVHRDGAIAKEMNYVIRYYCNHIIEAISYNRILVAIGVRVSTTINNFSERKLKHFKLSIIYSTFINFYFRVL